MATGISQAAANAAMDAVLVPATTYYVQLHTADPGAAGTTAVATESTRKAVTFAAAASGSKASSADAAWTGVPATENFTFFTIWDALTAGNFKWSGTVSNGSVTAGDDFTLPSADITLTMSGAA